MSPSRAAFWPLLALLAATAGPATAKDSFAAADPHVKFTKAAGTEEPATAPADDAHPPYPLDAAGCPVGSLNKGEGQPPQRFLPLEAGSSLKVTTKNGPITVVVQPGGADAIAALGAERRQAWGGPRFNAGQERMLRCSRGASQLVLLRDDGHLLGAIQVMHEFVQPFQIWEYDLDEEGRTKKVVLTDGSYQGERGLCVRFLDANGVEFHRALFQAFATDDEKNLDGSKTFKAICGTPVGS